MYHPWSSLTDGGLYDRINVDTMKMSDHVEFVAPQISDLVEPMAKRLLEGIPLT